jgi:hypothetical protein
MRTFLLIYLCNVPSLKTRSAFFIPVPFSGLRGRGEGGVEGGILIILPAGNQGRVNRVADCEQIQT